MQSGDTGIVFVPEMRLFYQKPHHKSAAIYFSSVEVPSQIRTTLRRVISGVFRLNSNNH
jgi:hypothetical protein